MTEQTDNSRFFALQELRDIIMPYVRRRNMARARIFGSYARGEADGFSDIDILADKGDNRFLVQGGLVEAVAFNDIPALQIGNSCHSMTLGQARPANICF